jgi:hypothetical protein
MELSLEKLAVRSGRSRGVFGLRGRRRIDRPLAGEALQDRPELFRRHAGDERELGHAGGAVDPGEDIPLDRGEP